MELVYVLEGFECRLPAKRRGNHFKTLSTTLVVMHTRKMEKNHSQNIIKTKYPLNSTLRKTVLIRN